MMNLNAQTFLTEQEIKINQKLFEVALEMV